MNKSKNNIPIDNFNSSKHDLNNINIYENNFKIKDIVVNKKVIIILSCL